MAGLVAGALVMVPGAAQARPALPDSQAGSIEVWGATGSGSSGIPVRYTYESATGPWAATTLDRDGGDFGLTSAGTLQRLSGTMTELDIPAEVASAEVKAFSASGAKAAVVKADGSVQIWGDTFGVPAQTLTPAALGAEAVDVEVDAGGAGSLITILLDDGRVVMVRSDGLEHVEAEPGVDLTGAVEIAANYTYGLARLAGGGVVAFSSTGDPTGVPAAISGDDLEDPVVSLAMRNEAAAVTESGQVYTWNYGTGELLTGASVFPTEAVEGKVIDVAASGRYFAALTDDQEVTVWGQASNARDYTKMVTVPDEVKGQDVAELVGGVYTFGAIVSAPLPDLAVKTPASISGTPQVGATLTGTPATFEGSPDSIANRWLADGEPIEGATGTSLELTESQLGKSIIFESKAIRGEDTLDSASDPVGPVVAAPVLIDSATSLTAPKRTYGTTGTATVTVSNAGDKAVTGTVTLTGAGAAQTKTVVAGKAVFSLSKTMTPKTYTLNASYSGNAELNPSSKVLSHTVSKGKSKRPTYKLTKRPTSKKTGKATITVARTSSSLATPTGKIAVTVRKGSSKKTIRATLSGGKRSITLPKLKKGTWKVQITYYGDTRYVPQKSGTYSLKIKK